MLLWLLNFAFGFSVDCLWIFYQGASQGEHRSKLRASLVSMLIVSVGIVGFIRGMDDKSLFVPYVLGAGTGTYIAMFIEECRKR